MVKTLKSHEGNKARSGLRYISNQSRDDLATFNQNFMAQVGIAVMIAYVLLSILFFQVDGSDS